MFDTPQVDNDRFAMHFYLLQGSGQPWPEAPYLTALPASRRDIFDLIQRDTDPMDVLLIAIPTTEIPLTYLNKLHEKFRIVLTIDRDPHYFSEHQSIITELCLAALTSHNFDILDAKYLLSNRGPIQLTNSKMIQQGWVTKCTVEHALLLLHPDKPHSEQELTQFIQQVSTALNLDCIAMVSFGRGRALSKGDYSVLAV